VSILIARVAHVYFIEPYKLLFIFFLPDDLLSKILPEIYSASVVPVMKFHRNRQGSLEHKQPSKARKSK
jgi:hypothetical protein